MKKLIRSFFVVGLLLIFSLSPVHAQTLASSDEIALRSQLFELIQKLTAILDQLTMSRVTLDMVLPPAANQPPTISAIDGPSNLAPSEKGTWRVTASDAESGRLFYSVFWGDLSASSTSTTESKVVSFTHSYITPGAYYLTFTVTNIGGKTTRANASVTVANRTFPTITGTAQVGVTDVATGAAITTAQITVLSLAGQIIGTGNTYSGPVTFTNLPAGAYTTTGVAVGYKPGTATFSIIRNGDVVQPTIRLTKIPVLPLTVSFTDSLTGSALANVLVTVYGPNGLLVSSRLTDSSGKVNFPNLPSGTTFQISAFLLGYTRPAQQTVTIPTDGSLVNLNFTLQKVR